MDEHIKMMREMSQEIPYLLLAQISRRQRQRSACLLDEIGLHRGQHWILLALHLMEGASQAALAAQIHVSAATLTVALQRLEKAGLVERRPDADDQRVSRVYLTSAGQAIQAQIRLVLDQLNSEAFAGLNTQEMDQAKRLLVRIAENLGEHGNDLCPKDACKHLLR